MKKYRLLLSVLLALTLCLVTACGTEQQGEEQQQAEDIQEFTVENSSDVKNDEFFELNFQLPVVSGVENSEEINSLIDENKGFELAQVEQAANDLKEAADAGEDWATDKSAYAGSAWDCTEQGDMISIIINWNNYTGGAHGYYYSQCINVNRNNGTVYALEDLFDNAEGVEYIRQVVLEKINENADMYLPEAATTVEEYGNDFNYYINGNMLNILFSPYEVGPYAAGICRFQINTEELQEWMKPDIYNTIVDTEPQEIDETVMDVGLDS